MKDVQYLIDTQICIKYDAHAVFVAPNNDILFIEKT